MTRFAKLKDGSWGLRGKDLKSGSEVVVTKRSGERTTATVGHVLWTGDDGTMLAKIAGERRNRRSKMGPGHGVAAAVPGYDSYCTDNDECRCYDCCP